MLRVLTCLLKELYDDDDVDNLRSVIRQTYIQGGPAKVRPTYIFDGNI